MKRYEQVYQRVVDLITAKTQRQDILPQSSVFDLAADSIQLFELVMTFEEQFKMSATYEDVMNIKTVEDIAHLIHRQVENAQIHL